MRLIGKMCLVLVCFALLSGSRKAYAADYPKSVQKKIYKAVKSTFSLEDVQFSDIKDLDLSSIELRELKGVSFSRLESLGEQVGYAGFASSKGKNDYFDYLVLFDNQLKVRKVVVLVYRSSYGGEITAKSWLKQFEGKSNGESMEFGKDVDSISGASISAPSISDGIKLLSLFLSKLKRQGKI